MGTPVRRHGVLNHVRPFADRDLVVGVDELLQHARAVDLDAVGAVEVLDVPVAVAERQLGVQAGLVGVAITSLLVSVGTLATLLVYSREALTVGGVVATKADLKELVPFGVQLTGTNAFSTLLYQVDVVVLAALTTDPAVVGAYALAVFATRLLILASAA